MRYKYNTNVRKICINYYLTVSEMFRKCPSVPQSYKDEEYKLYLRYSPIENDPHRSNEEISEHLVQWYTAANNLMKYAI